MYDLGLCQRACNKHQEQARESNYCLSEHYTLSWFYLKHKTFRRLDSVSVFTRNQLNWAQSIELNGDRIQYPKLCLF
jgi:hypothetical protein